MAHAIAVVLLFLAGNAARADAITFTAVTPQAAQLAVPSFSMEGHLVATVTRVVVAALGEKARGRAFKLSVVDLPLVNAFAKPDGTIVVFTGLLHEISYDPDVLAFVIGHELTHILNKHAERVSEKQVRIAAWSAIFSSIFHFNSESFKAAMSVGELVSGLPFARQLEHEADQGAVDVIFNMGISPERVIRFLSSSENAQKSRLRQNVRAMLCDHPADHDRISRINARYTALSAGRR